MSKKEAVRTTVIGELTQGSISNRQAAVRIGVSVRQVQRLKKKAGENGIESILHGNRLHLPKHALSKDLKDKVLELYKEKYNNWNFMHFRSQLEDFEKITISYSTVERILKGSDIQSPSPKSRPCKHRIRRRKASAGELVQMDASMFDWLYDGSYLHLHGAIDDATGEILALHLEKEETFNGYCELMFQMNDRHGLPACIYVDGRTVFAYPVKGKQLTIDEELAGVNPKRTQFARAMDTLNVRISIAGSPQAKGRVEKLWDTLQDRLAKEFTLHGICTLEEANKYHPEFISRYNRTHTVSPLSNDALYHPRQHLDDLKVILAIHETRRLDHGLSFSFNNRRYVLPAKIHDKEIPASPKDIITVVISNRTEGIRVLHRGRVLIPLDYTPLKTMIPQEKVENNVKPVVNNSSKGTPWRQTNSMFFRTRMKTTQQIVVSPPDGG